MKKGNNLEKSSENIDEVKYLQDHFTQSEGFKLNYRIWYKSGTTGKPGYLLLHGLASGLRIWDKVASELVRLSGEPVLTLDLRGHGLSDKPDSGYDYDSIIRDIKEFLAYQQLQDSKPVIVGHSWGATIALAYSRNYPDEVGGVVLVDGSISKMQNRTGRDSWEKVSEELAPPEFAGISAEKFLNFYKNEPQSHLLMPVWDKQMEDMVLNIVEMREDGTVGPRLSRSNHMKILYNLWQFDNYAYTENITFPVLMISAETNSKFDELPENDRFSIWVQEKRQGAKKMMNSLKNSPKTDFVIMSETIHDIPLQRPAELARLIYSFFRAYS